MRGSLRPVADGTPGFLSFRGFGFEYLEEYFNSFGVEVLVLNREEDRSPQQELVEDLLAIVASFAGKLYGHRSHKAKKLKEEVKEALERLDTDDGHKASE